MNHPPSSTLAVLLAATFACVAPALGQATETDTADDDGPPPVTLHGEGTVEAPQRKVIRLLREGSHLVETTGRLEVEARHGTWVFVIDPADPRAPRHELTMLPCSLLREMERMTEWAENRRLVFRVSGEVFVHDRRNYLLLTHPPVLVAHEPAPPSATDDPAKVSIEDDSAAAIIRQLEQAAGTVSRRPEAPAAAGEDQSALGGAPQREGSVIIDRRGRVRRASTGAYIFVFDADADGLADPPVVLMPCLLLERIDTTVRRTGEQTTLLMSGQIFRYGRLTYLMPSVFRIPLERTRIDPS